MSFLVRRAISRSRSFPRTMAVLSFLMISGAARMQTLIDLHP